MRAWRNANSDINPYLEQSLEGMADWRRRHAFLVKTIAYILIFAFIAYDITWAQGGNPIWHEAKPDMKLNGKARLNGIIIPYNTGQVQETYANGGEEVVINIQDAHASLTAQRSIVNILQTLATNYDLSLIALEGAEGPVDISLLRSFPDHEIRKETAEYLMRKGKMSAGEFFSVVSEKPIKVYGVEDNALYKANIEALEKIMPAKIKCIENIEAVLKTLGALEEKIYSKDLLALNNNSILHTDGKIGFTTHWDYIEKLARRNDIKLVIFENLSKLLKSVELEKTIDFQKANDERKLLIDEMSKVLPKRELEKLVLESLAFKTGKISQADFHSYIVRIAEDAKVSPKSYPNLIMFTRYISMYEDIDLLQLFKEVEEFEDYIRDKIFRNDEERTLYNLTKATRTTKKLFEIALTNSDHDFITSKKRYFDRQLLTDFIKESYAKYKLPFTYSYDLDEIFGNMDEAIKFYNIAQERNGAMISNTIEAMKENDEHVAALITGGFHSRGLSGLMKEKGLSYLVIMPKLQEGEQRPYIAVLTNKRQPYEELLEAGEYVLAVRAYFYTGDERQLKEAIFYSIGRAYEEGMPVKPLLKRWLRLFTYDYYAFSGTVEKWIGGSKRPITPKQLARIFGLKLTVKISSDGKVESVDIEEEEMEKKEDDVDFVVESVRVGSEKVIVVKRLVGGKTELEVALAKDKNGNYNIDLVPAEAKRILAKRDQKTKGTVQEAIESFISQEEKTRETTLSVLDAKNPDTKEIRDALVEQVRSNVLTDGFLRDGVNIEGVIARIMRAKRYDVPNDWHNYEKLVEGIGNIKALTVQALNANNKNWALIKNPENDWEDKYVFNAGVVEIDGNTYLVYRAMGTRDDKSRLGLAIIDKDGNVIRLKEPIFAPKESWELNGVEDPRITVIGNEIFMTYVALDSELKVKKEDLDMGEETPYPVHRAAIASISVEDFLGLQNISPTERDDKWNRLGPIRFADDTNPDWYKNLILFPVKINGKWVAYYRPTENGESKRRIVLLEADNIEGPWTNKGIVMGPEFLWDGKGSDGWLGPGAQPILTDIGWLLVYHGVKIVGEKNIYSLGIAIVDKNDPTKVLYRTPDAILTPENVEAGALDANVPYVRFSCGALLRDDGKLEVFYARDDSEIKKEIIDIGFIREAIREKTFPEPEYVVQARPGFHKTENIIARTTLKEEMDGKVWERVTGAHPGETLPRTIYKYRGRIIHVPDYFEYPVRFKGLNRAIEVFGKWLVPITELEDIRFYTILPNHIAGEETKKEHRVPFVYVENYVKPVIATKLEEGNRIVTDGVLLGTDIRKAKSIIDDYFKMLEDMWRCGIFNSDATLVNVGTDSEDKLWFFDLGRFTTEKPSDSVLGVFLNGIMQRTAISEDSYLENASPEVKNYFIEKAKTILTVENVNKLWNSDPELQEPAQNATPDKIYKDSARRVKTRITEITFDKKTLKDAIADVKGKVDALSTEQLAEEYNRVVLEYGKDRRQKGATGRYADTLPSDMTHADKSDILLNKATVFIGRLQLFEEKKDDIEKLKEQVFVFYVVERVFSLGDEDLKKVDTALTEIRREAPKVDTGMVVVKAPGFFSLMGAGLVAFFTAASVARAGEVAFETVKSGLSRRSMAHIIIAIAIVIASAYVMNKLWDRLTQKSKPEKPEEPKLSFLQNLKEINIEDILATLTLFIALAAFFYFGDRYVVSFMEKHFSRPTASILTTISVLILFYGYLWAIGKISKKRYEEMEGKQRPLAPPKVERTPVIEITDVEDLIVPHMRISDSRRTEAIEDILAMKHSLQRAIDRNDIVELREAIEEADFFIGEIKPIVHLLPPAAVKDLVVYRSRAGAALLNIEKAPVNVNLNILLLAVLGRAIYNLVVGVTPTQEVAKQAGLLGDFGLATGIALGVALAIYAFTNKDKISTWLSRYFGREKTEVQTEETQPPQIAPDTQELQPIAVAPPAQIDKKAVKKPSPTVIKATVERKLKNNVITPLEENIIAIENEAKNTMQLSSKETYASYAKRYWDHYLMLEDGITKRIDDLIYELGSIKLDGALVTRYRNALRDYRKILAEVSPEAIQEQENHEKLSALIESRKYDRAEKARGVTLETGIMVGGIATLIFALSGTIPLAFGVIVFMTTIAAGMVQAIRQLIPSKDFLYRPLVGAIMNLQRYKEWKKNRLLQSFKTAIRNTGLDFSAIIPEDMEEKSIAKIETVKNKTTADNMRQNLQTLLDIEAFIKNPEAYIDKVQEDQGFREAIRNYLNRVWVLKKAGTSTEYLRRTHTPFYYDRLFKREGKKYTKPGKGLSFEAFEKRVLTLQKLKLTIKPDLLTYSPENLANRATLLHKYGLPVNDTTIRYANEKEILRKAVEHHIAIIDQKEITQEERNTLSSLVEKVIREKITRHVEAEAKKEGTSLSSEDKILLQKLIDDIVKCDPDTISMFEWKERTLPTRVHDYVRSAIENLKLKPLYQGNAITLLRDGEVSEEGRTAFAHYLLSLEKSSIGEYFTDTELNDAILTKQEINTYDKLSNRLLEGPEAGEVASLFLYRINQTELGSSIFLATPIGTKIESGEIIPSSRISELLLDHKQLNEHTKDIIKRACTIALRVSQDKNYAALRDIAAMSQVEDEKGNSFFMEQERIFDRWQDEYVLHLMGVGTIKKTNGNLDIKGIRKVLGKDGMEQFIAIHQGLLYLFPKTMSYSKVIPVLQRYKNKYYLAKHLLSKSGFFKSADGISKLIPRPVKLALVIILAIVILPAIAFSATPSQTSIDFDAELSLDIPSIDQSLIGEPIWLENVVSDIEIGKPISLEGLIEAAKPTVMTPVIEPVQESIDIVTLITEPAPKVEKPVARPTEIMSTTAPAASVTGQEGEPVFDVQELEKEEIKNSFTTAEFILTKMPNILTGRIDDYLLVLKDGRANPLEIASEELEKLKNLHSDLTGRLKKKQAVDRAKLTALQKNIDYYDRLIKTRQKQIQNISQKAENLEAKLDKIKTTRLERQLSRGIGVYINANPDIPKSVKDILRNEWVQTTIINRLVIEIEKIKKEKDYLFEQEMFDRAIARTIGWTYNRVIALKADKALIDLEKPIKLTDLTMNYDEEVWLDSVGRLRKLLEGLRDIELGQPTRKVLEPIIAEPSGVLARERKPEYIFSEATDRKGEKWKVRYNEDEDTYYTFGNGKWFVSAEGLRFGVFSKNTVKTSPQLFFKKQGVPIATLVNEKDGSVRLIFHEKDFETLRKNKWNLKETIRKSLNPLSISEILGETILHVSGEKIDIDIAKLNKIIETSRDKLQLDLLVIIDQAPKAGAEVSFYIVNKSEKVREKVFIGKVQVAELDYATKIRDTVTKTLSIIADYRELENKLTKLKEQKAKLSGSILATGMIKDQEGYERKVESIEEKIQKLSVEIRRAEWYRSDILNELGTLMGRKRSESPEIHESVLTINLPEEAEKIQGALGLERSERSIEEQRRDVTYATDMLSADLTEAEGKMKLKFVGRLMFGVDGLGGSFLGLLLESGKKYDIQSVEYKRIRALVDYYNVYNKTVWERQITQKEINRIEKIVTDLLNEAKERKDDYDNVLSRWEKGLIPYSQVAAAEDRYYKAFDSLNAMRKQLENEQTKIGQLRIGLRKANEKFYQDTDEATRKKITDAAELLGQAIDVPTIYRSDEAKDFNLAKEHSPSVLKNRLNALIAERNIEIILKDISENKGLRREATIYSWFDIESNEETKSLFNNGTKGKEYRILETMKDRYTLSKKGWQFFKAPGKFSYFFALSPRNSLYRVQHNTENQTYWIHGNGGWFTSEGLSTGLLKEKDIVKQVAKPGSGWNEKTPYMILVKDLEISNLLKRGIKDLWKARYKAEQTLQKELAKASPSDTIVANLKIEISRYSTLLKLRRAFYLNEKKILDSKEIKLEKSIWDDYTITVGVTAGSTTEKGSQYDGAGLYAKIGTQSYGDLAVAQSVLDAVQLEGSRLENKINDNLFALQLSASLINSKLDSYKKILGLQKKNIEELQNATKSGTNQALIEYNEAEVAKTNRIISNLEHDKERVDERYAQELGFSAGTKVNLEAKPIENISGKELDAKLKALVETYDAATEPGAVRNMLKTLEAYKMLADDGKGIPFMINLGTNVDSSAELEFLVELYDGESIKRAKIDKAIALNKWLAGQETSRKQWNSLGEWVVVAERQKEVALRKYNLAKAKVKDTADMAEVLKKRDMAGYQKRLAMRMNEIAKLEAGINANEQNFALLLSNAEAEKAKAMREFMQAQEIPTTPKAPAPKEQPEVIELTPFELTRIALMTRDQAAAYEVYSAEEVERLENQYYFLNGLSIWAFVKLSGADSGSDVGIRLEYLLNSLLSRDTAIAALDVEQKTAVREWTDYVAQLAVRFAGEDILSEKARLDREESFLEEREQEIAEVFNVNINDVEKTVIAFKEGKLKYSCSVEDAMSVMGAYEEQKSQRDIASDELEIAKKKFAVLLGKPSMKINIKSGATISPKERESISANITVKNDPRIQAAGINSDIAQEVRTEAILNRFVPEARLRVVFSIVDKFSAGLEIRAHILDGGRRKAIQDMATEGIEKSKWTKRQVKLAVDAYVHDLENNFVRAYEQLKVAIRDTERTRFKKAEGWQQYKGKQISFSEYRRLYSEPYKIAEIKLIEANKNFKKAWRCFGS